MKNQDLERRIKERFNEVSDIFPESIEEDDFRVKVIMDFFGDLKGKEILDVGCGKGRFSKILSEKGGIVTGLDSSEKLLDVAKKSVKRANFVIGSATDLKFPDSSFDFLICVEVLEHVPDIKKSIREMTRVLKKDGRMVIIDKNKWSMNKKTLLPNLFLKKLMECSNRWMYPRKFPFSERWFSSKQLRDELDKYLRKLEVEYNQRRPGMIFNTFPFLKLFIIWKGIK